jgi:hypothetical protein
MIRNRLHPTVNNIFTTNEEKITSCTDILPWIRMETAKEVAALADRAYQMFKGAI